MLARAQLLVAVSQFSSAKPFQIWSSRVTMRSMDVLAVLLTSSKEPRDGVMPMAKRANSESVRGVPE